MRGRINQIHQTAFCLESSEQALQTVGTRGKGINSILTKRSRNVTNQICSSSSFGGSRHVDASVQPSCTLYGEPSTPAQHMSRMTGLRGSQLQQWLEFQPGGKLCWNVVRHACILVRHACEPGLWSRGYAQALCASYFTESLLKGQVFATPACNGGKTWRRCGDVWHCRFSGN